MKLFYALCISFIFAAGNAFSQTQLTNSDFELWDNVGGATEEPQEWSSNKTGSGFASLGPQTCFREATIIHGGTYAVRLTTLSSGFGSNVNGVVTCGRVNAPSTTPSAGYNNTQQANAPYNMPFTGRPDSIVFWVRYAPGAGDSGRVSILLHSAYDQRDPTTNDANGATNVIGTAIKNFGTTSGVWVRKSVPFTYSSGSTPAYCLATFTATKVPGGGSTSTVMYVDDVSMIYNPVASAGPINPLTYYVSSSQGAAVSVPFTLSSGFASNNTVTAQLSNTSGSFAAPVSLGSLANTNTSGTVSGIIPAGTPTGSGYRIRMNCSNPAFNGIDNGSNIQIYLVNNPVTPIAAQTLEASVNGTTLTATENIAATSREWKFATVSGGPYSSFGVAETNTTYTPNFATVGTYYVVCQSTWPGSLTNTSNEVVITIVDNAVNPSGSQSLLVGANGTLLTVTETPSGVSREWKWTTVSGGPYNSFGPLQTNMTYLPNFGAPGTWYVVCVSSISGVSVTSNEVQINVSNATITTGVVAGSPFLFSPSAPDANVTVPYTTNGTFNAGNVFTAELSDASGSFAVPVPIGTVTATTSGSINGIISHLTPAGTGYRIRVVSNNPSVLGSDNGTDLVVDQFNNSVSPNATQTIPHSTNGTSIAVTESQSATHNWVYSTIAGGPYNSFVPAETNASYTPNFSTIGTFYVACESTNGYTDVVTSNEVEIVVTNGSTLGTSAVIDPFYLSANAVITPSVNFTTDIIFNPGNVFTAEISDVTGSFASPTVIGTLNSQTPGAISSTIPNNLSDGTGYRIRVTSSDPATVGTDNGTDLEVIQFACTIASDATQNLFISQSGTPVTVTATHSSTTQFWKWRTFLSVQNDFSPAETGASWTPNFATPETYFVKAFSINVWNDTVESSNEVGIIVTDPDGISESITTGPRVTFSQGELIVDLSGFNLLDAQLQLYNAAGQLIESFPLASHEINRLSTSVASGIYFYLIAGKEGALSAGKLKVD
jgi:hypothetical protein